MKSRINFKKLATSFLVAVILIVISVMSSSPEANDTEEFRNMKFGWPVALITQNHTRAYEMFYTTRGDNIPYPYPYKAGLYAPQEYPINVRWPNVLVFLIGTTTLFYGVLSFKKSKKH